MRRRFPSPLLPGMTVGLIAPASPVFETDRRDAAVQLMEEMGFRVIRGASVDAVDRCFAGTDALRAGDVMEMFLSPKVDGIVCLRGGYGCARLLSRLDWAAIARHPKPFVGFSDITALHAALFARCGLITFHGPMPGAMEPLGLREARDRAMWLQTLSGKPERQIRNPDGASFQAKGAKSVIGPLIGGNLSVLCSLIGTPYEPCWEGALLLLEDVAERTAHLDAMVQQLESRGVFRQIRGLVLGDFSRYEGQTNPRLVPLTDIFPPRLPRDLPVLWGLHAGHGRDRMTLALGARYRLNPSAVRLTLLEDVCRHKQNFPCALPQTGIE